MSVHAYIKYIKTSPKKLRAFMEDIKTETPTRALQRLYYNPQRSAKMLYKGIKQALDSAVATTPAKDAALFEFDSLVIEEGPVLKRFRAGSRGIARPYKRRTSHIKIVLKQKKALKIKAPKS